MPAGDLDTIAGDDAEVACLAFGDAANAIRIGQGMVERDVDRVQEDVVCLKRGMQDQGEEEDVEGQQADRLLVADTHTHTRVEEDVSRMNAVRSERCVLTTNVHFAHCGALNGIVIATPFAPEEDVENPAVLSWWPALCFAWHSLAVRHLSCTSERTPGAQATRSHLFDAKHRSVRRLLLFMWPSMVLSAARRAGQDVHSCADRTLALPRKDG